MEISNIELIGKSIKNARKIKKINQQDFAEKLGISSEYLCKIENGKLTNYSIDIFIKICEKLDLKIL